MLLGDPLVQLAGHAGLHGAGPGLDPAGQDAQIHEASQAALAGWELGHRGEAVGQLGRQLHPDGQIEHTSDCIGTRHVPQ
jgi:hypothetical protein